MVGNCMTCEASIELGTDLVSGEIIECQECGQEHEVKVLEEKIDLDFAPEVEEDWGE